MNLKIRSGAVRYNNRILVSDGKFSPGKNAEVNSLALEEPVVPMPKDYLSHKVVAQANKPTTQKDEKIALVTFLSGGFTIWNIF